MPLTLRNEKGSKLTYGELDGNFTYLEDKIDNIDTDPQGVVKTTSQTLTGPEKNTARSNIEAIDVRLNDLAPNLTVQEQVTIKNKIGVTDLNLSGYVINPEYNSETFTLKLPIVANNDLIVDLPFEDVYDKIAVLRGITLEADQANAIVYVKDGNGVTLASLPVGFLNNEGTTFVYNSGTNALELWNDQGEMLSSIPVSDFVTDLVKNANWNGTTPSRLDFKDSSGATLFYIEYSISNIAGLQAALDNRALTNGTYPNLNVGNSTKWNKQTYGGSYNLVDYDGIMIYKNGEFYRTPFATFLNALNAENFALTDGSNTVGGTWDIEQVNSVSFGSVIGNGQVFSTSPANGQIYWGNPKVLNHTFEMAAIDAMNVYIPGNGFGKVWNTFTFNPATKQDKLTAGANIQISPTSEISATNTTYSAGNGITLSGTQFSMPVTASGSGNVVTGVVQNTNGLTVTYGTITNTQTRIGVNNGSYTAGDINLVATGGGSISKVSNTVTFNFPNPIDEFPLTFKFYTVAQNETTSLESYRSMLLVPSSVTNFVVKPVNRDGSKMTVVNEGGQSATLTLDYASNSIMRPSGALSSSVTISAGNYLDFTYIEDLDKFLVIVSTILSA